MTARGAKVYATARDPRGVDLPGAVVLPLDVTGRHRHDGGVARGDPEILVDPAAEQAKAGLCADLWTVNPQLR